MISLYSAGNEIGVEGAKLIGLALQTNNTLTSLDLTGKESLLVWSHSILQTTRSVLKVPNWLDWHCKQTTLSLLSNYQVNSGHLCVISLYSSDNSVGVEGAKLIGLALQTNKTLTSLNLGGKECLFVWSHSILQTTRLVLRVPNWLEWHCKQTTLSLLSIYQVKSVYLCDLTLFCRQPDWCWRCQIDWIGIADKQHSHFSRSIM